MMNVWLIKTLLSAISDEKNSSGRDLNPPLPAGALVARAWGFLYHPPRWGGNNVDPVDTGGRAAFEKPAGAPRGTSNSGCRTKTCLVYPIENKCYFIYDPPPFLGPILGPSVEIRRFSRDPRAAPVIEKVDEKRSNQLKSNCFSFKPIRGFAARRREKSPLAFHKVFFNGE
ncbi:MAG: hypothetical protein ACLFRG_03865 [Desulfococcaceae bacterium]